MMGNGDKTKRADIMMKTVAQLPDAMLSRELRLEWGPIDGNPDSYKMLTKQVVGTSVASGAFSVRI